MEYLTEKKNVNALQKKKEEKLFNFREYLADSGVIESVVKYILACRKQSPWPEDPLDNLHEYFDNYRDPSWDEFENMKEEIKQMSDEKIPGLEQKIIELQNDIKIAKRHTRTNNAYAKLDAEGTDQIGTKAMISKLSGNNKFDTDTKMTKKQFYHLLIHICDDNEEDDINFDKFMCYFEQATGEEASPPFAGDLENADYVTIQEKMRSFQPPEIKEDAELEQEAAAE